MKPWLARQGALVVVLVITLLGGVTRADWAKADPGLKYVFPRDHFPHFDFKTEWWYFTGNLRDASGRRFGYQITFFRQGIRPPSARGGTTSRFIVDDLKIAHFALTDVQGNRFRSDQKISRGAFGDAGFGSHDRIAWIDDWSLRVEEGGAFRMSASGSGAALEHSLTPLKPRAVHGQDGVSNKAAAPGHASHYYSGTRLATIGRLTAGGQTFALEGESWFDHEWATNQLTPDQLGWDWFSLQFEDGTELMLYQMRLRKGGIDSASSGSWIVRDGTVQHLTRDAYALTAIDFWRSEVTGGRYPIGWKLEVPGLGLRLRISTPFREQELALKPVSYWEGMIDVTGSRDGRPVRGHGYLELTGYVGELVGLSAGR